MFLVDRLIGLASPAAALRQAIRLTERHRFAEAFPLLAHAAKAGLPDAEYRIARSYLEGAGVPQSQAEGVRWLQRAASHGCIEAQPELAALCVHGLAGAASVDPSDGAPRAQALFAPEVPAEPDFASAMNWARQAAEAGSAKGEAMLGYILTCGPEHMRDLEEVHRCYQRSAAAGCPEGSLGYALSLARRAEDENARREVAKQLGRAAEAGLPTAIYLLAAATENGLTARDPPAAAQLYRRAAEKGHRAAQVRWGLALMDGRGVAQDVVAGESWLRRAALAGDCEAAALVGDCHVRSGSLPPNYSEAANWYRKAAEAGHKAAARALGSLYLTGAGVAQDDQEAVRWLRVAAEAGDPPSQVDLANLVLQGEGNPDDPARIAGWFARGAASGDLAAAVNLAVCLTDGIGVDRDEEKAAQWLRYAAEEVAEAQYRYGRMLADGRGVARDVEAARAWFARALGAGSADAGVALAEMLANGRGGPRDPFAALELFEKAAAKGHSGAMFALGALLGGGHDLPRDPGAALRWFRAAAERGHGHAQLMLGRYLAGGFAGERDFLQARLWLERAVAQGLTEANCDLSELESTGPA